MKYCIKLNLLFLGALVLAGYHFQVAAQEEERSKFWLEPTYLMGDPLVGASLALKLHEGRLVYAFGASEQLDFCFDCEHGDRMIRASYIRVGQYLNRKKDLLLEVGAAQLYITRSRFEEDESSVAVPIRITKYYLKDHMGIGWSAELMFNTEESVFSLGLSLPFGKL